MTTNDIRLAKTGLPQANAVRTWYWLSTRDTTRRTIGPRHYSVQTRYTTPDLLITPFDYITLAFYSLYEGRRILIREATLEDTVIGERVDLEACNIALYTFPIRHTPSIYTGYVLVRLLHCTTGYVAERCAVVA